ncbi:hypothetical protein L6164_026070 [Bauhinia variegata]|uniref:Uncharacterized protein n=1 Tax=Bauhinia variegata TaxID=167791 RepID=A0ACB9M2I0_BAUVA|nr:hypothetical protein L6164_026070 [Bauhinia variegata]
MYCLVCTFKDFGRRCCLEFAKEHNIDMVALNPAMVVGPLLQPTLNTSAAAILNLIVLFSQKLHTKNPSAQTFINFFCWMDRYERCCLCHVQAFEIPSASGRYCLAERVAHYSEIVEILHELYPSLQLPERCTENKPFMPAYQISKEKAKSLGIEFTPLDVTPKETVESLREKKFVIL